MDEPPPAPFAAIIRENSAIIEPVKPPPLPPGWTVWKAARGRGGRSRREGGPSSGEGSSSPAFGAVLFDVYGTLFCSAAGDPAGDPAGSPGKEAETPGGTRALDKLAASFAPGRTGTDLRAYFRRSVAGLLEELRLKTDYPELRVEEIWARFLEEEGAARGASTARRARELALRYELAVNPVFPMPGARGAIARLAESGLVLGIVSNAQFFTPLLFDAFFGGPPDELGFDPGLLFYSFEFGEAKPSPRLFAAAAGRLAAMGIPAERCLCLGNDMRNDVAAALGAGFAAALFAGDGRSLRLREEEGAPASARLRPSYIIDSLADLPLLCAPP
ncbi:MAG: HAD family hydrolase [Treponema sp.]|jgi:putative hydrolase of the HAD superfamily|nr:HAD family hydrolase [Treponema sp.]